MNAKPKEKPYKLTDGKGMFLMVMPNGNKFWRLKYYFDGRENQISFGEYPKISLKEARRLRDEAKISLKSGIDPMEPRREARKNRKKPEAKKNLFNLSLSGDGELTIETTSRILCLTAPQTDALRSFLIATPKEGKEGAI
ncbi:MAG: DUF4102 domain-containing protein [Alphaproteobacteria bacterium]|nr:DUF4102 domain-containing protein [Alphaproteobacteria bacterium]